MRRTLAALVAASAVAVPTAAEAVTLCRSTGGINPIGACVIVELNGDGDTVNPTVRWGCRIGFTAECVSNPISTGTTGVDDSGRVWVAGQVIL